MRSKRSMILSLVAVLALCFFVTGCGPDEPSDNGNGENGNGENGNGENGNGGELSFGIYSIDDWTYNRDGCDVEGDSVADQRDPYLLVNVITPFGFPMLQAYLCANLDDCRERSFSNSLLVPQTFGPWDYEEDEESNGWFLSGIETRAVDFIDETCHFEIRDTSLQIVDPGQTIVLERVEYSVTSPAQEGDSASDCCPEEDGFAAAEAEGCSGLQVAQASFLEPLPDPETE